MCFDLVLEVILVSDFCCCWNMWFICYSMPDQLDGILFDSSFWRSKPWLSPRSLLPCWEREAPGRGRQINDKMLHAHTASFGGFSWHCLRCASEQKCKTASVLLLEARITPWHAFAFCRCNVIMTRWFRFFWGNSGNCKVQGINFDLMHNLSIE